MNLERSSVQIVRSSGKFRAVFCKFVQFSSFGGIFWVNLGWKTFIANTLFIAVYFVAVYLSHRICSTTCSIRPRVYIYRYIYRRIFIAADLHHNMQLSSTRVYLSIYLSPYINRSGFVCSCRRSRFRLKSTKVVYATSYLGKRAYSSVFPMHVRSMYRIFRGRATARSRAFRSCWDVRHSPPYEARSRYMPCCIFVKNTYT